MHQLPGTVLAVRYNYQCKNSLNRFILVNFIFEKLPRVNGKAHIPSIACTPITWKNGTGQHNILLLISFMLNVYLCISELLALY